MAEKGGKKGAPEQVVDNVNEEMVLRKLLTANNVKEPRVSGKHLHIRLNVNWQTSCTKQSQKETVLGSIGHQIGHRTQNKS
jgi:hypothetical protein